ncbi:MAG: phenylalanine--tRNA ligase subunit beta, partial [Promicromonosporaceae bacterium]|nr:phenylalanine--tRNA ligase subunit beta [Promicromonosporaceae bacterium]
SPLAFPVEVDDTAPINGEIGCDRFATRIVRGIDGAAVAPAWLRQRLEASGMRSISLAVDITNYVMLDLGQPVHAYDLAKLRAPIVVRRANSLGFGPGEELTTLDDVERKLDKEDLLITDSPDGVRGSRVLGLAGVMGGASTEVTAATTDVLIECAHFDPVSVARTARRHKLPSEAAKRFERGVDPALPPVAAEMVVELLVKYGGGVADPAVGDLNHTTSPSSITLPLALPSQVVGVPYSEAEVRRILNEIGAKVSDLDAESIAVVPPTWRPDLTEPVDLVEEIARIAGYDQIPSVLPPAPGSTGLSQAQRIRRSVARTLAEAGLVEVLSYPFVGEADWEALSAAPTGLRLANPLTADRPALRTSLLITLLDTARRNFARGITDFGIYELGLVTDDDGAAVAPVPPGGSVPAPTDLAAIHAAVPAQPRHVAAVLVGEFERSGWWGSGRVADWSDALGLATVVAERAGVSVRPRAWSDDDDRGVRTWHPGRSGELVVGAGDGLRVVGVAGELHPRVCANFGLPKRAVAFELDLAALEQAAADPSPNVQAKPVSAYPVAKEDFAFVVDREFPAGELRQVVANAAGDYLESIHLFDIYTGDQLSPEQKSLAFNVQLRAPDKTLTVEQVREVRERILAAASAIGAQLRGS